MKKRDTVFYKLARPDGFDFYSGKMINYREAIGKEVICPGFNKDGNLCSDAFIHASRKPDQCFVGAKIPCSAYLVEGIPIKEDADKCGFERLTIVEELKPEELFKWNYVEACNPIHPFRIEPPKIDEEHVALVKKWVSVGDSVRDSVGDSVWASVGDSVWAYLGWIFSTVVKKWKYCEKIKTKKDQYPFKSAVDLWMMGLIPSFDGKTWKLHGGINGKVLWEGKI